MKDMESILMFIIPLSFIFGAYPVLNRVARLKRYSVLLKLCLSLVATTSFTVLFSSFWGIVFPRGFIVTSRILFAILVLLTIVTLKDLLFSVISKGIKTCDNKTKILSGNKVTYLFLGIFILVFLLIFTLRPVVDSDVVDSYLPLARSIVMADKIPAYNYYDGSPFAIPPVGGPSFFAYYYTISGNIFGEVFRFINIPYFLGILLFSYYIFSLFFPSEYSLLGVLIILVIPFLEGFIFEAGFYPDFIFAFLSLFCFWFMLKLISSHRKKYSWIIYALLGLSLGASLLIKYQAIFLYALVFGLGVFRYFRGKGKILYLSVPFVPFLLKIFFKGEPYTVPQGFAFGIFFAVLLFMAFWSVRINIYSDKKDFYKLVASAMISLSGFIFILRNYLFFGNFTSQKLSYNWASSIGSSIGVVGKGGIPFETLTFIFGSSLAVFWLLPKITGVLKGFSRGIKFLPVYIFFVWYSWWVLFLGAADTKWLLPVIPFLAVLILDGLKKLSVRRKMVENIVYAGVFFHFLSSKFLLWNFWSYSIGNNTLRYSVQKYGVNFQIGEALVPEVKSHFSDLIKIPNDILEVVLRSLYILASRVSISPSDIPLMIILAFLLSITVVVIGAMSDRLYLKKIVPAAILILYGYIFIAVSGGINLLNFTKREQNMLFDYWGQSTTVVPYLASHSHLGDRIVVFGTPSGLSYYSGLQTYNVEYGGGLSLFYPVFESSNFSDIYSFYKKNRIKFVLISTYGTSVKRFDKLRDKTKIFDILGNNEYSKKVISSRNDIYWDMYEII